MSKGRETITVRLGSELRQRIDDAVAKRNAGGVTREHWDLTKYVVRAITEKLAHDSRGVKKGRRVARLSSPPFASLLTDDSDVIGSSPPGSAG
jgi:hypothetical protein